MSSYISNICSLFEKRSSTTKADNNRPKLIATGHSNSSIAVVKCGYNQLYTSDSHSDDDYCFIDNFKSLPINKLLSLDNLPCSFSGNDQDVIIDFTILLSQIKYICQSLDTSGAATQFSDADGVIGDKLKKMVLFICNRYHEDQKVGDSGIAFLALMLLGNQVLETVPEVQQQLLYKTCIGRDIILNMVMVLRNPKNKTNTPRTFYDQIQVIQLVYGISNLEYSQDLPGIIDVLTEVSARFAGSDKEWELFENYATVVILANDFFIKYK